MRFLLRAPKFCPMKLVQAVYMELSEGNIRLSRLAAAALPSTMTALKLLGLVLVVGSIIVMNVSFKRPDSAGA